MTPIEHLSGEFDKILKYAIKADLAAFLATALPGEAATHIPYALKKKWDGDSNKPKQIKSWLDLDLKDLLEVLADRFNVLTIGDKSPAVRKCITRMRDLRNEGAHFVGDVDILGLYVDTGLLKRFANFIGARQATLEEIHNLEERLRHALEQHAGVVPRASAAAKPEAPTEKYYEPSLNTFGDVKKLLSDHEEFVGRSKIVNRIREFVEQRASGTLIIEAEPGTGKSALIAHCVRKVFARRTPRPACFIYYASDRTTDPSACIRTLYDQLVVTHSIDQAAALEPTDDARRLRTKLEALLADHVAPKLAGSKQVVFIDGLDEADIDKGLTAHRALPTRLPHGIIVVATTRRIPARCEPLIRREGVEWLNLNPPDRETDDKTDAEEFVRRRLAGKQIDTAVQREICTVGEGNFLVLRELCRWVGDKLAPGDVPGFMHHIAAESDTEVSVLFRIYEEFWRRLPKQDLDTIGEVAGLLLAVQGRGRATESLCVEALDGGLTKWAIATEAISEYLRPRQDVDGSTSYRIYHQSFADFLHTKVTPYVERAKKQLAAMCLRWRELSGAVRMYAVQFGPEHLSLAAKWTELEGMLTDLEFVEEKCQQGMIDSLFGDYQSARRSHPEWLQAAENELRREDTLNQWAKGVMEAGHRWRAELIKCWATDDSELIEAAGPFQFPSPPDTIDLCEQLIACAAAPSVPTSSRVAVLQVFRSFVFRYADKLARHPESTLSLALNYHRSLAEQAEVLLRSRGVPWMEFPGPDVNPGEMLLPELRVDAVCISVSADGKRCVTGEQSGGLRFWDLETGKCLDVQGQAHQCSVLKIVQAVDGSRVISIGRDGTVVTHEFRNRQVHSRECALDCPEITAANCSPEASLVVLATAHDEILFIDGQTGEVLPTVRLSHSELERITHLHLIPERFELRAADQSGNVAIWDLRRRTLIGFEPPDQMPDRDESEELETRGPYGWLNASLPMTTGSCDETENPDRRQLGQFWNRGFVSADGLIEIKDYLFDIETSRLYAGGSHITTFDAEPWDLQLTADGRVLWMLTPPNCGGGISGIDVLNDVVKTVSRGWTTQNDDDTPKDVRHAEFEVDCWTELDQEERLPHVTLTAYSHAATRSETDGEADDCESQSSFAAITPGGQIAISVIAPNDQESQDQGTGNELRDTYHAIHIHVDSEYALADRHLYSTDPDGNWTTETCEAWNTQVSFRVMVSPNGKIALVTAAPAERPIFWFVWDIPSGKKTQPDISDCSAFVSIMPDWKAALVLQDEMINVCDLGSGQALSSVPVSKIPAITPDGRRLVICANDQISVWSLAHAQLVFAFPCPSVRKAIVSPDANFLVCWLEDVVHLYELQTGQRLLTQVMLDSRWIGDWEQGWWRLGDSHNELVIDLKKSHLAFRNLPIAIDDVEPIVTATRLFRYDLDDPEFLKVVRAGNQLPSGHRIPGAFDAELTVVCPKCDNRFPVPREVAHAIERLSQEYGLSPEDSPCLRLPDGAWDDTALRRVCEHCRQPLRLNPFVV